MSLLTVGTVAFDSIETPYGKVERVIGGAATYICWAASYFCEHQNLVSVVGDDWPEHEIRALNARGVDTRGLQVRSGAKSFFWAGRYHYNMNHRDTLVTDLNVLADFDPVLPEPYQESDYLMLGNLTPEIQMEVIRQLEKPPRLIAMDTMNFWMDISMDSLLETIGMVDVLTINDEEARQLSGEYSLVKAARKVFELGPRYLVIKKGEHGALLFHEDEVFFAPALPLLDVKDPTGAGDTFAGGFMGYLASTNDTSFENLKRALIYGSAMASFCVEEFSLDRLKSITPDQLNKRLGQFKNLVHYNL
jgi:sugar/nucleoside kinase (ribokinase family)